jgi:hypothetical protein
MTTFLRTVAMVAVASVGFVEKSAEAQVSLGIATPGFSLGVGPGAGYVGGGYFPGYPVVVPPPYYAPRPVFVPPPVYGRPFYGGYGPGYGRPHYGPPRYGYPQHYRR